MVLHVLSIEQERHWVLYEIVSLFTDDEYCVHVSRELEFCTSAKVDNVNQLESVGCAVWVG